MLKFYIYSLGSQNLRLKPTSTPLPKPPIFDTVLTHGKGQIEVTRRRGRRRKKLLDDLKDRRGHSQLKEEALDPTVWRIHFGRGFGPVVWQTTDDDDDDI